MAWILQVIIIGPELATGIFVTQRRFHANLHEYESRAGKPVCYVEKQARSKQCLKITQKVSFYNFARFHNKAEIF